MHNQHTALSKDHIEGYTGTELEFELLTLTEWDYLTEVPPEEVGLPGEDSSIFKPAYQRFLRK